MKDEQRFEMQPKIVGLSLHFQIFSFPYDAVDFALCAVREEIFMEILITAKHIIMFLFGSENRNILYALIITVLGGVTVRADDGLGKDFGVLLRPGPRRQIGRICSRQIHVVIHQRQKIEAV